MEILYIFPIETRQSDNTGLQEFLLNVVYTESSSYELAMWALWGGLRRILSGSVRPIRPHLGVKATLMTASAAVEAAAECSF